MVKAQGQAKGRISKRGLKAYTLYQCPTCDRVQNLKKRIERRAGPRARARQTARRISKRGLKDVNTVNCTYGVPLDRISKRGLKVASLVYDASRNVYGGISKRGLKDDGEAPRD